MKIAFYKGKKRVFNKLVSWWTRGPYSHTELVLDDGISVSSSFMDGGVRYKRISFSDDHWDFIELGPEPDGLKELIDKRLRQKYDWRGLVGFVIRRAEDDRNKVFCSEFCMEMLGFSQAWRFDPNTAYPVVERVYGKQ